MGNLLYKRIIDHFGTPEKALTATLQDLSSVSGLTHPMARAILEAKETPEMRKNLEYATSGGYQIVTLNAPEYPSLLKELLDPPPFFYIYGSLENTEWPFAVVGSRNISSYGKSVIQRLCKDLVSHGMAIVSGMARGIDTVAHESTLAAGGKTIAVLGSGFADICPPENKPLVEKIAQNGAVISEFSPFTKPDRYNFPLRNQVISGISVGTLVVEATRNSGSLITARMAAEQNREVFAVPGSIESAKSLGTHALIKQGAKLVETAQDILDELFIPVDKTQISSDNHSRPKVQIPLSESEQLIYSVLDAYPIQIDELAQKERMDIHEVSAILLTLEIKSLIRQMTGRYILKSECV